VLHVGKKNAPSDHSKLWSNHKVENTLQVNKTFI